MATASTRSSLLPIMIGNYFSVFAAVTVGAPLSGIVNIEQPDLSVFVAIHYVLDTVR
jgi:hypothetical protein